MHIFFSYEDLLFFYYLLTKTEIKIEEIKANEQKPTPTSHTNSIDPVESNIRGVIMLSIESNKNGIHTPIPIKVS